MSAPVHRSEAPIPRARRPAQRQRQREALEERGQLALALYPSAAVSREEPNPNPALIPDLRPHTTRRTRPTPDECAREPWRLRVRVRAAIESGTAPYVLVRDPSTGAVGYLRVEPAIVPTSQARFARSRPLPPATQPVPLFAAEGRA